MTKNREALTLIGTQQTRKQLKEFAPDLLKELDREVRKAVNEVKNVAKANIPDTPPISGWNTEGAWGYTPEIRENGRGWFRGWPAYVGGEITRGIKVKKGRNRKRGPRLSSLLLLRNENPAGNIFELAGRSSSGNTDAGRRFIQVLNSRNGQASRVIWNALDTVGDKKVQEAVRDAYALAEKQLQARLNAINSGASVRGSGDAFMGSSKGK